jgi:hypothetical protein
MASSKAGSAWTERRSAVTAPSESTACLRLAIVRGGLDVGGDDATVFLDRPPPEGRLVGDGEGPFWIVIHNCQGGPMA